VIREFSAGGVVIRNLRGRPHMAVGSFFLFRYRSGRLQDHDHEVEEALWIPLEEAPERLAYKSEKEIAQTALSRVAEGS
jgi:hypothetical protein